MRPGRAAPSGSACGANPVPIVVPCHRVVPAAGGVGNYGLGPHRKVELLRREGSLDAVEGVRGRARPSVTLVATSVALVGGRVQTGRHPTRRAR